MSYSRLMRLIMNDVLPFNFGTNYESWVKFWDEQPNMRELVGSDPHEWTPEVREAVN